MHALHWLLAVAGCAAGLEAAAFEARSAEPGFVVSVPALPAIELAAGGTERSGHDARHEVTLSVTPAAPGASPRSCAGQFLRVLVRRPGMPDRDSIYRAPLDESTFLVLYILGTAPTQRLHAHLVSAADGAHCVEAHFTRALAEGEDEDGWRRSFSGAHIGATSK